MKKQEAKSLQQEEQPLSQPDVGGIAHTLIQECKQTLRSTPEFAQALQDKYFSNEPTQKLANRIKFRKGDYCYEIQRVVDDVREELHVSKLPVDPDAVDWEDEVIKLETLIDGRDRTTINGTIRISTFFKTGGTESFRNTYTAIQKVKDFFKANF